MLTYRRPIHYAAWNDFPAIITLLLEAGADLDARTDYGESSLHLAAVKASNGAIKVLIAAGLRVYRAGSY